MNPVEANRKIDTKESNQHAIPHPTFGEAFRFWVKLGFISFGGPAGQISIMHHELVDRKKWVSNERFLNALNYCMLLPGPEAQQLATYIGWLLHRLPGGVVAGAFFVIPSIFILFALSYTYAAFGTIPWVASVFNGLKAAIMAIVVSAVIKIGKKALKNGVTEALFFTKAAFLTFGGAYAVLAYIAQAGVEQYGWLTGPQMIDGLGLAETTPGPLIMVVQFVGFMAGWNHSPGWSPVVGGMVGSLVATYFTFLPCFLFVFLGGPYIEKFRDNATLSAALSSITAAVVGVVLNLAVWFGLQVLMPAAAGFNWFAAVIGLAAFISIQWFKVGIMTVIAAAGIFGFIWHQLIL